MCCTGGEEGDILNPAMDTPEVRADIGRVRMAELKAATDIIGYDETVLLGYRDSGMPNTEANARPDSFAQAPLDEAVGRLVEVIRRERPQVIVTYGDNQTEYPHPDHIRVHEISVLAFDSAGDPDRFRMPDRRTPRPSSTTRCGPARALPRDARQIRRARDQVAVRREVDGPDDAHRALHDLHRRAPGSTTIRGEALKAHATQVDPNSPFWFGLPPEVLRGIHPVDEFRLAQSRVGPTDVTEDDLFAGVRSA